MTDLTAAEFAAQQVAGMTEAQLQSVVERTARKAGWMVYHTRYSLGSTPGYPDLTLVHPTRGLVFRELKTEKGSTTAHQREWLEALNAAWVNKSIENFLYGEEPA